MKKLYTIWRVTDTYENPMTDFLTVVRWRRDQLVSRDYDKIKGFCDYLNEIAYEDERYEIREEVRLTV